MMNRHFIFALCAVLGFSVSGVSMAQSTPADKEAAAKAAKAAKVKFRWGKSLKSAQKQAEETGLPIVLLFTGTSWCGYCIKLEKEILSKKEFKQGMDGVAIGVKFEFGSSDFSKSKEAKTYRITGVPAMVVVDAEGKELGRTGYIPGQTPVQYVEILSRSTRPRLRRPSNVFVPDRNVFSGSGGRTIVAPAVFWEERWEIFPTLFLMAQVQKKLHEIMTNAY